MIRTTKCNQFSMVDLKSFIPAQYDYNELAISGYKIGLRDFNSGFIFRRAPLVLPLIDIHF